MAEYSEEALASLQDTLQQLPEAWIICRDVRHAWTLENDFHVVSYQRGAVSEIRRTLKCVRCTTLRIEVYVPSKLYGLEKVSSYYSYPDNYQIHGVPRGVKPAWVIHGEQYRRAMERQARAMRENDKEPTNG